MGGEVIIITQDPDFTGDSSNNVVARPITKVRVTNIQMRYSDFAHPQDVAAAVHKVLAAANEVAGG